MLLWTTPMLSNIPCGEETSSLDSLGGHNGNVLHSS